MFSKIDFYQYRTYNLSILTSIYGLSFMQKLIKKVNASKARVPTFQSIMQDLKNKKFAPIYMLMGEESYYIDQISGYIAEHVLSPEERDFNQTICFGSDVTAVQVADMARRIL